VKWGSDRVPQPEAHEPVGGKSRYEQSGNGNVHAIQATYIRHDDEGPEAR